MRLIILIIMNHIQYNIFVADPVLIWNKICGILQNGLVSIQVHLNKLECREKVHFFL